MLPLAQVVDEHDLTIGKLQGIVMHSEILHVDLPEARHLFSDFLVTEGNPTTLVFDPRLERDFSPRKQADGHVGFA